MHRLPFGAGKKQFDKNTHVGCGLSPRSLFGHSRTTDAFHERKPNTDAIQCCSRMFGEGAFVGCRRVRANLILPRLHINNHDLTVVFFFQSVPKTRSINIFTTACDFFICKTWMRHCLFLPAQGQFVLAIRRLLPSSGRASAPGWTRCATYSCRRSGSGPR
jgi:hypothetical protein